jgi:hypothetical protein
MAFSQVPAQRPRNANTLPVRRRVLVVAGVLLLAVVVSGIALYRSSDEPATGGLTVGWGGSEGHPCCVYDADVQTVDAELTIDGTAPRDGTVTVTVRAYADENTSKPVGSSSRTVHVEGTVHMPLLVTIAVERAPHVDEDGVAACTLSVQY